MNARVQHRNARVCIYTCNHWFHDNLMYNDRLPVKQNPKFFTELHCLHRQTDQQIKQSPHD